MRAHPYRWLPIVGALALWLADRRWRDRSSRLLVIYDGVCRLCQWQADWLRRLVDVRQVELVPYQTPGILARHPDLDEATAQASLQVVTASGERYDGARAVVAVLRTVPLLALLTLAYELPGVSRLAEAGYALIARNRFHILGRLDLIPCDETCRRPTNTQLLIPRPCPLALGYNASERRGRQDAATEGRAGARARGTDPG